MSELTTGNMGAAGASSEGGGAGASGGGVAAGGGNTGTVTPVASGSASGGSGSWLDTLPDEFKSDASIQGFKSPVDLVKSYIHAQKMVGADKIPVPGKHATEDDWKSVFKKLGLPESPDKYELQAEGADPEFIKGFKEAAHKYGILPKQAQELYGWYSQMQKSAVEKAKADYETQTKMNLDKLKEEWGGDAEYTKNLSMAKRALFNFFGKDTVEWVEKTGLGNDPQFIKLMHKVGKSMGEDVIKGDGGVSFNDSDEALHKQISEITNNYAHPYWDAGHPEHYKAVEHVQGLYNRLSAKK